MKMNVYIQICKVKIELKYLKDLEKDNLKL